MRRFHYRWMHVPSARGGFGSIWCNSADEFRKRLRHWTVRGVWKFKGV